MFEKYIKKWIPGDAIAVKGTLWNVLSMGIVGIAGIGINILIATLGSSEWLGLFNQIMAIYIILGQIASGGTQYSVLYFWINAKDEQEKGKVCCSLLWIAVLCGISVVIVLMLFVKTIGIYVYDNSYMLVGIKAILPALFLFGINKMFLGFLNANREMKRYAILQMLRYSSLIAFLLCVLCFRCGLSVLFMSFAFAEIVVFIGSIIFVRKAWIRQSVSMKDINDRIKFGFKAMVGGIIGETNTKIDILVLGLFCDAETVGIYSFASLIAEGFYSLIVIIRNNINPIFSKAFKERQGKEIELLCEEISKKVYILTFSAAGIICLGYYLLCRVEKLNKYTISIVPMGIIMFLMCVAAPEIVKGNMLTVSGNPYMDSKITALSILSNFILNMVLIPYGGIYGAAIATGLSYLFYKILLCYFLKKKLGV